MKKSLIITVIGLALLLISFGIVRNILPVPQHDSKSRPKPSPPKPDNIDSLTTLIRKDKLCQIDNVIFAHKDSTLLIIIRGENASTRYFDSAYHISAWPSIDGITILNTNNRQLDASSRRGARLLAAFKDRWCTGNECRPMTARIKQDIAETDHYMPIGYSITWLGDNSFIVRDSFHLKNAAGSLKTTRVEAQIDMQGNILAYNIKK